MNSPRVYEYLNYREFLRAFYVQRKQAGRAFSYRAFSRRAGLGSPNHLKRVMDGDRNLSSTSARKYATGLALDAEAAEYFLDLVEFNQASTHRDRTLAYRRLTRHAGFRQIHELSEQHDAYHANWYVPAIRELARRPDFESNPAWIAKRMIPAITTREAASALEVLYSLGFLQRAGDDTPAPVVTTGAEARGHHIATYHRAMMERAADAMDHVRAAKRDVSSVTLCMQGDGLQRLKDAASKFRREVIALEAGEGEGEQVVQVNIQIFPLSTAPADEVSARGKLDEESRRET